MSYYKKTALQPRLLTALSSFRNSVDFCKERYAILVDRYLNLPAQPEPAHSTLVQTSINAAQGICEESFNTPTIALGQTLETLSLLLEIVEADAANSRRESLSRNLRLGESWIVWLQKGLRRADRALCELEKGTTEVGVIGDGRLSPGSSACCAVNLGRGPNVGVVGQGRPAPCAEVAAPVTVARAEIPTPARPSRFRTLFRTLATREGNSNAAPLIQNTEVVVMARPSARFTFRFPIPNSEGMMPPPRPARRVAAEETGSPSRKRKFHTLSLSLSNSTRAEVKDEIAKSSSEPATPVSGSEASTLINTPTPSPGPARNDVGWDDDDVTLINDDASSAILLPSLPSSTYSEFDDLPEVNDEEFRGPEFYARTGEIPPFLPTVARFSFIHEVVQEGVEVREASVQSWLDRVPNPSVFQALDAGDEGIDSDEEDDELDEVAEMSGDDEEGDDEFERFYADMAELAQDYEGVNGEGPLGDLEEDDVDSEATTLRLV